VSRIKSDRHPLTSGSYHESRRDLVDQARDPRYCRKIEDEHILAVVPGR
jgi:hypothetical protein